MSTETGISAIIPRGRGTEAGLQGRMGALDVMFAVLAYNAPAVVFMGALPVTILVGNGIGTPALFLAIGALLMVVGSGLINLTSTMQRPGGFYSIASASLGKVPGLGVAFAALLTYLCAMLGGYAIGSLGLVSLIAEFTGVTVPWWLLGIIMAGIVGVLGYLNIQFSAKVLYVFLGLEFLLILLYVVMVLLQGGAEGIGFESFAPENIFSGNIATGALFVILCFGGFEATVIFREELRKPEQTIKRATFGTVGLIAVSYAVLAWVFINAYGPNVVLEVLEANVGGAAGDSVREYVGDAAYVFANILLVTSAFALMLASHNVLTRYIYNFGKDGILPKSVGLSHPRHESPYRASVWITVVSLVGVITMALLPLDPELLYATTAAFLSYGLIIMLTVIAFAAGVYMLRHRTASTLHIVSMFAAGVVLACALLFASIRFDLLSGFTGAPAIISMIVCWVLILSGCAIALVLRRKKPEVFARIGRDEG